VSDHYITRRFFTYIIPHNWSFKNILHSQRRERYSELWRGVFCGKYFVNINVRFISIYLIWKKRGESSEKRKDRKYFGSYGTWLMATVRLSSRTPQFRYRRKRRVWNINFNGWLLSRTPRRTLVLFIQHPPSQIQDISHCEIDVTLYNPYTGTYRLSPNKKKY